MSRPKRRRILGIDPGIARTGYAVLESFGNAIRPVTFGCIETTTRSSYQDRLEQMERQLTRIITTHKPTEAAVEKLFFARNVRTAFAVGQARGVILLVLGKHRIVPMEFTPQQVKVAVSGYGNASKEQVQRMVQLLLGLKTRPKPDDTADAIAIALTAAATQHQMQP